MKEKKLKRYKIAQQDYEISMLPQTRRAVFLDVFKLQWRKLIILGGILVLFSLPLIVLNLLRDGYAIGLFYSVADAGEDAKTQAGIQLLFADVWKSLLQIIPFMIIGVGLAGVLRVLRQFAWGENVYIPTDFSRGVKDNLRPMLCLSFLAGLVLAVCYLLYYMAVRYQTDRMWMVCIIPIAFSALFVLPVFTISIVMIPVYNNPLMQIFRMAFLVYIKGFGKVLLGVVLTVALSVIGMLPNTFCHFVFGLVAAVTAPVILLGWTLFCYNRLDKDINPIICPELIGKGLFIPPEEGSEEF